MSNASQVAPFAQKKRIASLWVFSACLLLLMVFSHPAIDEDSGLDVALDPCGLFLVLAGVFGRLWSIIYIGGRKNSGLVTTGPYSLTRNPLYLSSVLAICGIGLMFCSLLLAAIVPAIAIVIFLYTAGREARYLHHVFGTQYLDYARTTPLFWPELSSVSTPAVVPVSVRTLKFTFQDALFLIFLLPFMELLEHLRLQDSLPVLFSVF